MGVYTKTHNKTLDRNTEDREGGLKEPEGPRTQSMIHKIN